MNFIVRGTALSITAADVLRATRDVEPGPTDARNRYFVTLHGKQHAIKAVLRLVTGLPSLGFTAQDAHRILSRLGFQISERSQPAAAAPARTNDHDDPTSPGGLAVGEAVNQADGEVRKLLVVFQIDEDGWQVASCPTLPGCHSQGRTRAEALDNVREAVKGYLASLREHDATPPPSSEFQVIEVQV